MNADEPRDPLDDLLDAGLEAALTRRDAAQTPVTDPDEARSRRPATTPPTTTPPSADPSVRRVGPDGRYEIAGELGRGGMGVVYEARDLRLGRTVALKALRDDLRATPERIQRFIEEAQIAGQLQHPGIVPVHDLETARDEIRFFTMKLVSGETLKERLATRETLQDRRERFLRTFLSICEALAYAHARGVIHRDLKPSNVMVGSFGEVHVMDWGLAKVLGRELAPRPADESSIFTVRRADGGIDSLGGTVMGTPAYMSPEQARGEAERVDRRSDVFALGAILCEILTGQPPYVGTDPRTVHALALRADLSQAHARLDVCGADAALVALTRACLSEDPGRRPDDASMVAQGVADHLASLEAQVQAAHVQAASSEASARHERHVRKLTLALGTAAVLVCAGAAAAYSWVTSARADRERETAAAVLDALGRANGLRDRALSLPEAERAPTLAQALAAADEAGRVGAAAAAPKDVQLRAQSAVLSLRDALAAAEEAARRDERGRVLAARLEEVRALRAQVEDPARQAHEYDEAFRAFGVDVSTMAPAEVAKRLDGPHLGAPIATAFDWWAVAAHRAKTASGPSSDTLLEIGKLLDPDPKRQAIRRALHANDVVAMTTLADPSNLVDLPPATAELLADAVGRVVGRAEAVRLFRIIRRDHPGDVWANVGLSSWLDPEVEAEALEARDCLSVAVVLAPSNDVFQVNLASVSFGLHDVERARRLIDSVLTRRQDIAVAWFVRAQILGLAKDAAGEEAALRRGIACDPRSGVAHNNLGALLSAQGRIDDALREFDECARVAPTHTLSRSNALRLLVRAGRAAEAEPRAVAAVAACPKDAEVREAAAQVLDALGRSSDGLRLSQEAVALEPDNVNVIIAYGNRLVTRGDILGGEKAYRRVLALAPAHAMALTNLAQLLRHRGRYDEAFDLIDRAEAAGGKCPEAGRTWGDLKLACREGAATERRIQRVLLGIDVPSDDAAWDALLRHAASRDAAVLEARLWEARLHQAKPDPTSGARFYRRASMVAIRAAFGPGDETAALSETDRAHWRDASRTWLSAQTDVWAETVRREDGIMPDVRTDRDVPLRAADFAPVREPASLEHLPPAEADAWRALWARIRALE